MMIIEAVILYLKGKPLPRFNDSFSSIANGLLSLIHGYVYILTHYSSPLMRPPLLMRPMRPPLIMRPMRPLLLVRPMRPPFLE